VVLAAYGLAIAVSKTLPAVAMGLVVAIPVGMLIGILPPYESTTWPVASASLIVGFVVALFATTLTRWVALTAGVAQAMLVAFIMVVPTAASPHRWESWLGIPEDLRATSPTYVGVATIAALLFAIAWAAGLAVRSNTGRMSGWSPAELTS
jgi:hypothetical protein